MASDNLSYCVECGAQLEPAHQFCWRCGARRWSPTAPASTPSETTKPPVPRPPAGPPPAHPAQPRAGTPAGKGVDLGFLPWLYAAGAIFFLVWATQALALILAPAGRFQLVTEMGRQGVPPNARTTVLVVYGVVLIGAALLAVGLHAAAFYGLRRRRWWGWLAAVVVAGIWSLVIVGLPVLLRLVSRNVREAFGME